MARVKFVDTSVLVEILRVPGKCQRPAETREELERLIDEGYVLVLPITTVLETGNHIEQIPNGHGAARRSCAERYVALLRATADPDRTMPWVLHAVAWDERMLTKLCDGVSMPGATQSTGPFVDLAGAGVLGAGDLAILAECELYADRTAGVDVGVWTYDERLAAYGG